MSYGICDYCGDDVMWALTTIQPGSKGGGRKRMPLDPQRYPDDDVRANVAVSRDHLGSMFARVLKKGEELRDGEHRAMTHFATCKNRPGRATKTPAPRQPGTNVLPFKRR